MTEATKMQEVLSRLKGTLSTQGVDLSVLTAAVKELKEVLVDYMLHTQLSQLKEIVYSLGPNNRQTTGKETGNLPSDSEITHEQALDNLEEISTHKQDKTGKRWFLLHRATQDYEYEKSKLEGNEFRTEVDTEWTADYMKSEDKKEGANPTVSCWISESDIKNIPNPHINVGTWGDLGKNPFASKYKVVVKPGTYNIHQEYRGE